MSDISDALHEAVVAAVTPFVDSIGAEIVSSALDLAGAVVKEVWNE